MAVLGIVVLLTAWFVATCRIAARCEVSERSKRFSKAFHILLLAMPLAAAAVFAVLFAFVLHGRFVERLAHAMVVFALWLYAARFYWLLASFFRHRRVVALSIPGFMLSVALAALLTPLDRYVDLLHAFAGAASLAIGPVMLAVFYACAILFPPRTSR
jgi:small-conductance mechanosensitive channel